MSQLQYIKCLSYKTQSVSVIKHNVSQLQNITCLNNKT